MATMDLIHILGFCAPLSTFSKEFSLLQDPSVSIQNHNVEIYRDCCVDIVWREN